MGTLKRAILLLFFSVQLSFFFRSVVLTSVTLALGLGGCQPPEPPQISRPASLPQDPQIQVFMNHDTSTRYTEPYRKYTRDGANFEQLMIDAIAAARSSVDVAVQEFRLPGVAQALAARQQAGVRVRIILENTYARPYSQFSDAEIDQMAERERDRVLEARQLIDLNQDGHLSPDEASQQDALIILDQAHIPRMDDTADGSAGSNLMHHKFLVIDEKTVVVTSANFTPSDVHGDFKSQHSRGNANNLLKIENPRLARLFTEEFNYLWGDGPGGKTDSLFGIKKPFRPAQWVQVGATSVGVQFSPSRSTFPWEQSSNGLISKTLSGAKASVQMALFVFSDQQLVNQLEQVHRAGVEIQALIEPGFAYRPYSEALDMMGIALADDCKLEATNHPWQPAIATVGVPRMPPGDLLHHKFGIVDRQTVITGSHNWTDAANRGNDETVLVIQSSVIAAHYQREFERLYMHAILGVPAAIQKKAKAQAQQCRWRNSPLPAMTAAVTTGGATVKDATAKSATARGATVSRVEAALGATSERQRIPSKRQPRSRKPVQNSSQSTPLPHRVNLNTATQSELEQLPGVGPSLAKRIIASRQKRPFRSLNDLDQVSGIGKKLLAQLKDQVEW